MATMSCDQASSCGPISTGTPSISAMMVIGSGAAKAGNRSTWPLASKRSISSLAQRFDARAQPLDLARDEGAVDQRAQARVHRRLQLQHRIGLDGVEGRQVRAVAGKTLVVVGRTFRLLAAEAAVAQQAVHVVVAGQAPEAEIFPEEAARIGVQPRIGLVRVLHETLLVRVEPQAARSRVEIKVGWRCGDVRHGGLFSPPCQA